MELKLFVKEPLGDRDRLNIEVAKQLKEEYPFYMRIIRCGSVEHAEEPAPPPCPSVYLDGRLVKEFGVVTRDELKTALFRMT